MSLKISCDLVVTFEYDLFDDKGSLIDSSKKSGPITYLHGHENILKNLELNLEGKIEGETFYINLDASEAYGEYDKNLICQIPKDQFNAPENLVEGQQFEIEQNDQTCMVYLLEIHDESVIIDGNHPLAGKALKFDILITEVREARTDEFDAG